MVRNTWPIDWWNLDGAIEDFQLQFFLGVHVANQKEMPTWNPGDEFEAAKESHRGFGREVRAFRRGSLLALLMVMTAAPLSEGAGVEIAIFSGPAIATYKQTLTLAGGSPAIQMARLNVKESPSLDANGGIAIQVRIARGFAVVGEARGFAFRRAELQWTTRETGALSPVEKALLASVAARLELPRFTPGFWTARAGVAYRF